jgi:hypothetical protein
MTNNDTLVANELVASDNIEMLKTSTVTASNFIEEINKDYELLDYI